MNKKINKFARKHKRKIIIIFFSLLLPSLITWWVLYMLKTCNDNIGCLIIFLPFTPIWDIFGGDLVGWPLITLSWIFYMAIGALIGVVVNVFTKRKK